MKVFHRTQRVDRWRLGWNHAETPSPGGLVDHVLNRGVARLALFEKDEDSDGESTTDGSGMERRG